MNKYILIKSYKNLATVQAIDVTGKSEREIEKIDNGININLDHVNYYTETPPIEFKEQVIK